MGSDPTLSLGIGALILVFVFVVPALVIVVMLLKALNGLGHLRKLDDISNSLKEIERHLANQKKLGP
jgi:chromate transport protein ChrA